MKSLPFIVWRTKKSKSLESGWRCPLEIRNERIRGAEGGL